MDVRVATGIDVLFVTDEGIDQHPVEDLAALLDRDDGLVWVDVPVCDEAAARVLTEVFGFHPLAVRDCVERNAVPKVRAYRDHVFVVLHEAFDAVRRQLGEEVRQKRGEVKARSAGRSGEEDGA